MPRVAAPRRPHQPAKVDPFRFGWRFVKQTTPEGDEIERQVPLTEEDVLHPQEEDFIVNTDRHDRIAVYLKLAGTTRCADRKDILVVGNLRVDWASKHGWAHGPDVAVFKAAKASWRDDMGTLHVAKMKAKPLLVVEATSPSTRGNDFGHKLREYYLVNVPVYVIIDIPYDGEAGDIQLFGFQAGKSQYEPMLKDDQGRLWLEALGLWLGVADGDVFLEDAAGNRLPDYETLVRQNKKLTQELEQAMAKLRELEEKLARRPNGKHS